MAVQVSYPGVYIEEFAPGAPIQGVGTSTAAFIGVAARGPLDEPVKVTSFTQFASIFGTTAPQGMYLWYAVRGFFENGGQVCHVVRASNGSYQRLTLNDRTLPAPGRPVIDLQAREPGLLGITADVADAPYLDGVELYRPSATLDAPAPQGTMEATVAADGAIVAIAVANRFRAGDEVSFSLGSDRRVVASVSGAVVRFTLSLSQALAAGATMRLANTTSGARTIRLRPPGTAALPAGQLVPGTILTVEQGATTDTQVVESVLAEVLTEGAQGSFGPVTYRVTLRSGLNLQLDLDPLAVNAPTATSREINLSVALGLVLVTYDRLSMDPAHPRYLTDVVNADPGGLLTAALIEPPPPNSVADAIPTGAAQPTDPAQEGGDEDLSSLRAADFTAAIDTLLPIDDVNFIAIPDRPTMAGELMSVVQQALVAHCELLADRFAVLDCDPGVPLFGSGSLEEERRGLDSTRGYAALYAPWLRVVPAGGGPAILVPPSGHVCGIFARSDTNRGVHKAPANEYVNGALGVETRISQIEQGQLNLQGINIVQVFQDGGRPILWGARTTATDTNWQYVNIRRLFLYLEESIQQGLLWTVFEPNNLSLWQKAKRTLTDFLTRAWRDGALFGAKAEEAFYVRIDAALNPPADLALGRLTIEIGVCPTRPAEFIVVRIGIWDGGSQVNES